MSLIRYLTGSQPRILTTQGTNRQPQRPANTPSPLRKPSYHRRRRSDRLMPKAAPTLDPRPQRRARPAVA